MEIIRKQNNQIGLSDLTVFIKNGIYYTQGQDGKVKEINDIQFIMLLKQLKRKKQGENNDKSI